ncbi:MAG: hypothetical protein M1838_003506 [Thelocarpon superellum]|nr:MAG: hypothetical protein M1838_003506 [Thelocarpon superellum]
MTPKTSDAGATSDSAQNDRFFRYFQHEATGKVDIFIVTLSTTVRGSSADDGPPRKALQDQMDRFETTAMVGGERADAVDHCLAGIARLSSEVKDASSYLPAYDQRTYSTAIKALSEKLQETRATFAPKPKFSFKTRKNNSAISLQDAAEMAKAQRLKVPGNPSNVSSSNESSFAPTPILRSPPSELNDGETKDPTLLSSQSAAIRKPSFSKSNSVVMSNHKDVHIILPTSASNATSSSSVTSIRRCVIDMASPTATGHPFAGLVLRSVRDSLIICGHVTGPAHVTGVEHSIVVVACRQFRMHECHNVDVYLLCASRPIIEDCTGIRFAPIPSHHVTAAEKPLSNHWDQVDDFKWLKAEHSPNWSVLAPEDRLPTDVWTDLVPGGPGVALADILARTVGIVDGLPAKREQ